MSTSSGECQSCYTNIRDVLAGEGRGETSTLMFMFQDTTEEKTLQVPFSEGQEARNPIHYYSAIDSFNQYLQSTQN